MSPAAIRPRFRSAIGWAGTRWPNEAFLTVIELRHSDRGGAESESTGMPNDSEKEGGNGVTHSYIACEPVNMLGNCATIPALNMSAICKISRWTCS